MQFYKQRNGISKKVSLILKNSPLEEESSSAPATSGKFLAANYPIAIDSALSAEKALSCPFTIFLAVVGASMDFV